ncbi:MAG: hypothetical protein IJL91_02735 [Bacteroidales bacterium]|jgi:hypothetical protein|nr:hypothetical protein [Bacteroidales bacterium]MBQ6576647.1 hypothetical protein [Bacteroidales bacterium]
MKHQRITPKQAKYNCISFGFYTLMGIYWLVTGILDKKIFLWVMGGLFTLLNLGVIIYTIWQLKHYPLEDPVADAQIEQNAKTGMTGMAIVMGIIAVSFLVAFGLAYLLKV